jgi:hypothetical protein
MADAQAAMKSADELGASRSPQGSLHLKLAQEEIATAKRLIDDGDNDKAASYLLRARGDADLALADAQETNVRDELARAQKKLDEARAAPASTTTTTGATVPAAQPSSTTTTTTTTTQPSTTGGVK